VRYVGDVGEEMFEVGAFMPASLAAEVVFQCHCECVNDSGCVYFAEWF
jgi:hypothetical protein